MLAKMKEIVEEIKMEIKNPDSRNKYLLILGSVAIGVYLFIYSPIEKKLLGARRRASNLYRKAKSFRYFKRK